MAERPPLAVWANSEAPPSRKMVPVVEVLGSKTIDPHKRKGSTEHTVRLANGSVVTKIMKGPSHWSPPAKLMVTEKEKEMSSQKSPKAPALATWAKNRGTSTAKPSLSAKDGGSAEKASKAAEGASLAATYTSTGNERDQGDAHKDAARHHERAAELQSKAGNAAAAAAHQKKASFHEKKAREAYKSHGLGDDHYDRDEQGRFAAK